MMKFSFDWSNATSPERRDLIFENRNKEYGGYALRRDYQRNVIFAMLFTFTGVALLISTPLIISHFSKKVIERKNKNEGEIVFENINTMEQFTPIQQKTLSAPSTQKTVALLTPVVVNEDRAEDIATQELARVTDIGDKNQEGEAVIDLPSEPVVEAVSDIPLLFAEEMPAFIGGEENLFKYLSKIKYPGIASQEKITGRVYVSFIVDRDGKVKDAKVIHGIGGGCDEEALRVVSAMPAWNPGRQNGKNVAVMFRVSINFNLR